jgi:hypothetical protein
MTENQPLNPYEAPRSASEPDPFSGPTRSALAWDPIEAYSFAWGCVKRSPISVLAVFVASLIGSAVSMVGSIAQNVLALSGDRDLMVVGWIVYGASFLIGIPIQIWMMLGAARYCLALARGREPEFGEIFGSRGLGSGLGAYLILLIASLGAAAALLAPGIAWMAMDEPHAGSVAVLALGFAAFMCAGIYFWARWFVWAQVAVDRNPGSIDTLGTSWSLTRGQFWRIVLFWLVTIGVTFLAIVAGALMLCIGLIVTIPVLQTLVNLATAYVYLHRIGERPPQAPARA